MPTHVVRGAGADPAAVVQAEPAFRQTTGRKAWCGNLTDFRRQERIMDARKCGADTKDTLRAAPRLRSEP